MKIVLVNPSYIRYEGVKESGGHGLPLNLSYLVAHLRENLDCEVKIIDAEILDLSCQE